MAPRSSYEPPWSHPRASGRHLGAAWEPLGATWEALALGATPGSHPGAIWEPQNAQGRAGGWQAGAPRGFRIGLNT